MDLIIYSNPSKNGFCGVILDQIVKILKRNKQEFEILDLYAMKYDPIVKLKELNPKGGIIPSKDSIKIQEKITTANRLIFIYPVWWGVMPAILKGFIDRTITAGFAYKFNSKHMPVGLLKKKALVFMTSGAPKLLLALSGNRPKKNIAKDILGFCGIKTNVYQFGSSRNLNPQKEKNIRMKINKILK
jgi:NAD(P)H dehydrogenase (quinone)